MVAVVVRVDDAEVVGVLVAVVVRVVVADVEGVLVAVVEREVVFVVVAVLVGELVWVVERVVVWLDVGVEESVVVAEVVADVVAVVVPVVVSDVVGVVMVQPLNRPDVNALSISLMRSAVAEHDVSSRRNVLAQLVSPAVPPGPVHSSMALLRAVAVAPHDAALPVSAKMMSVPSSLHLMTPVANGHAARSLFNRSASLSHTLLLRKSTSYLLRHTTLV